MTRWTTYQTDRQKSGRQFSISWTGTQLIDSRQFRQSRLAIASAKAKEVQPNPQADTVAPHLLLPKPAMHLNNFEQNLNGKFKKTISLQEIYQ